MAVYIVTVEATHKLSDYSSLFDYIKQDGSWACLGTTTYLVESEDSAVELRDRIKRGLLTGDSLYVGKVDVPAAWTGLSKEVSSWIKEKL